MGFVAYLEKENQGLEQDDVEHFFNQYGDEIGAKEVVKDIDGNTAKLKKKEPKFYSITINPSPSELRNLQYNSEDLKRYTRALMTDYAKSFKRELICVLASSETNQTLPNLFLSEALDSFLLSLNMSL